MTTRAPEDDEVTAELRRHLAEALEGSATTELMERVAASDRARDLLYDAERTVEIALDAAADYQLDLDRLEREMLGELETGSVPDESGQAGVDPEGAELDSAFVPVPAENTDDLSPSSSGPIPAGTSAGADETLSGRETPPTADAAEAERRRKRRSVLLLAALAAGALLIFLGVRSRSSDVSGDGDGWSGRLVRLSSAFAGGKGFERCSPDEAVCARLEEGHDIPAGSVVTTDGQTRGLVDFADGSRLALERSTRAILATDRDRGLRLERGALVIEVTEAEAPATVEVPSGRVEATSAKMAIEVLGDGARVDVLRGEVRVIDKKGEVSRVLAGETVELGSSGAETTASPEIGNRVTWTERAFSEERDEEMGLYGLGQLVAKKPGTDAERPGAVTLASHTVRVRISGGMARTEIDEVFQNHTDEVLEGILRFPLPPGAQIERLALETDGRMEEGAFVDRDRAAGIWRGAIQNAAPKAPKPIEEIVWVPGPWRDPALLEWQRGGRFELRVFPIPKKGSRRVVLAYTERVPLAGERRRFTLPLPHDPSGSARLERFAVDVAVRGHDQAHGVRAIGYELETRADGDLHTLTKTHENFSPSGDLVVEYALPDGERELSTWTYAPGPDEAHAGGPELDGGVSPDAPFAVLSLRPKLPRWAEDVHRSYAIVVDSSRSMIGERYRRASELAVGMVREMGREDSVTVLACDTTCREAPKGSSPGADYAAEISAFLRSIVPEGGSDVARAITSARSAAKAGAAARIVYIGDGTPTVGPTQPAFLGREVRAAVEGSSSTVTTVPIGADADTGALETIAIAGGGVMVPHVAGRHATDTVYAVLGATYGHTLADASIELPEGLVDVAPARLPTLVAGGETFVVARMSRPRVEGTVLLRGRVGREAFVQRYPLQLVAATSKGNAFVPRLFAAKHIEELERDGGNEARRRAVALSSRYSVASRYTSLLVLESPAMFRAFGLDNTRHVATWTGDEADEGAGADGEMTYDDGDVAGLEKLMADEGAGRLGTAYSASKAPAPKAMPRSSTSSKRRMEAPAEDFAPAPAAAAPTAAPAERAFESPGPSVLRLEEPLSPPPPPRRRMIPMRKVWERFGKVEEGVTVPSAVTSQEIARAEQEASGDLRREALSRLYRLYFQAGRLEDAANAAERWSAKDPLDPDALTARADVAAARGDRELAIRILGSVVDVRPGDHKAQWRLARLHRWAGRPELGCRHSLAVSQIRPGDAKLLVEAVRCARDVGHASLADELLRAADETTRTTTERLLRDPATDTSALSGDFRLEATWDGNADVDLAIVSPEGHRISWLGAPTRAVITARDVLSSSRESLALRGAQPGDYVLEVGRAGRSGGGPVRGHVDVTVGKTHRSVPFVLEGDRVRLGLARIQMRSKLVPL